jgi:DUF4097 and DUF4098 domain-containing protein YvlB
MTPARRAVLAIGVPVVLAIIAWNGFSFIAQFGRASFGVDYAFQVRNDQLSLNGGGGNVTVRPGQGSDAHLVGTVQYSLVRPVISRSGSDVSLRCRLVIDGGCDFDAALTVPPRTGLTLSSGGGDLSVSGMDAGVSLSSDGGNVAVSGVAGKVSVSTGGGDLTADHLTGILSFTTDGGNVNGTALTSPNINIRSYGGDVTLTFTQPPPSLTISTYGGNVHVEVPRNSAGYVLSADPGGGNLAELVKINDHSPDAINIVSDGGDISVTYSG